MAEKCGRKRLKGLCVWHHEMCQYKRKSQSKDGLDSDRTTMLKWATQYLSNGVLNGDESLIPANWEVQQGPQTKSTSRRRRMKKKWRKRLVLWRFMKNRTRLICLKIPWFPFTYRMFLQNMNKHARKKQQKKTMETSILFKKKLDKNWHLISESSVQTVELYLRMKIFLF